jgi:hypothetical protein
MHPNVSRYWTEWKMATLVVETDLETDPSTTGFGDAAFNAMVEAVLEHFKDHPARSVRFIPLKANNPSDAWVR